MAFDVLFWCSLSGYKHPETAMLGKLIKFFLASENPCCFYLSCLKFSFAGLLGSGSSYWREVPGSEGREEQQALPLSLTLLLQCQKVTGIHWQSHMVSARRILESSLPTSWLYPQFIFKPRVAWLGATPRIQHLTKRWHDALIFALLLTLICSVIASCSCNLPRA